jgi:hypothetical protein
MGAYTKSEECRIADLYELQNVPRVPHNYEEQTYNRRVNFQPCILKGVLFVDQNITVFWNVTDYLQLEDTQ